MNNRHPHSAHTFTSDPDPGGRNGSTARMFWRPGVLHEVHRRQETSSYQVTMIACSAAASSIQARLSALAGREG